MMGKPKVLWVSRHKPLDAQLDLLSERLGDYEFTQFSKMVPSADWLAENVIVPGRYQYVIPVLPLSFIARLAELQNRHGFTLLWAQMQLLHNDYSDSCPEYDPRSDTLVPGIDADGNRMWRHYRFQGFKRVKKIELVLEDW